MNLRTFIAIDIPDSIKNEITKIQNFLPEFTGKKTERENLHLTLKFLGEIDEEKIELIKEKLREIKIKKFETIIDKIGFFDNRSSNVYSRNIIVWLHLTNCEELQKQVDEVLKGLFEPEKRFMSHMTIARVKKIKDKTIFIKDLENLKIPEIKFMIKNFKLKNSILKPKGPKYEDLEIYNLI